MKYNGEIIPIPKNAIVRDSGVRKDQVYIVTKRWYDPRIKHEREERKVIGLALDNGKGDDYQLGLPATLPCRVCRADGFC